jgi:hypothetical protein
MFLLSSHLFELDFQGGVKFMTALGAAWNGVYWLEIPKSGST